MFGSLPLSGRLPTLIASRYLTPLREGGSLPAVVETEAHGLFVLKFRGAGQRERALVAEIIVGRLGQALGLPVPELALIELGENFGRSEPDPEIQDLLRASHGINVGLRYLEGAFNYDPVAFEPLVEPALAADTVWLDAFVTNIDRTPRNPNIMIWERRPWLIDHGAALYFHHHWATADEAKARQAFAPIGDHVLLARAGDLQAADQRLVGQIDEPLLRGILGEIPDTLLAPDETSLSAALAAAEASRAAYLRYFLARIQGPRAFVDEALRQQALLREQQPRALERRR
jgi:hypothetical protein